MSEENQTCKPTGFSRGYLTYVRKRYSAKLLFGLLKFSLTSEYRGNGEYKHMVSLKLLREQILSLTYRTGETEEGVNISTGRFTSGKNCIFDNGPGHCKKDELHKVDDLEWRRGNLLAEMKAYEWSCPSATTLQKKTAFQ